jgi:hypothetical protein
MAEREPGMNEDAPDWYIRYAQYVALQGGDASLRPGPDPLVKPEDVQKAHDLRQAGRLN